MSDVKEWVNLRYQIAFSTNSLAHLRMLTVRQQRIIMAAVTEQLAYEPNVPTRNRKQMRPNLLAVWELRIDNIRVYYDIEEDEDVVDIRAIGIKEGNQVFIEGKVVEL